MNNVFKTRIKRVLLTLKNIDPDAKHTFGYTAERYVKNILLKENMTVFSNKIVKHPKVKNRYIESDIIACAYNTVFCIEIKRLKGKILPTKDGIIQEQHKTFERRYRGYRVKKLKDPQEQSKLFTKTLRNYLTSKDSRFKSVKFIPISVFSEEADISEIHSLGKGILYIRELVDFIKIKSSNTECDEWIKKTLESLKGFDIIINRNNLEIKGFILNENFECKSKKGTLSVPYSTIKSIHITKKAFLSAYDTIKITKKGGEFIFADCFEGHIIIDTFESKQKHLLQNLKIMYINSR